MSNYKSYFINIRNTVFIDILNKLYYNYNKFKNFFFGKLKILQKMFK